MKQITRVAFFTYLFWVSLVISLSLKGSIVFGHGLGDLYYLIRLVLLTVVSLVFYVWISKKNFSNKGIIYIFLVYLITIIVYFCLKLTLFRGAEYPWDGKLFM